MERTPSPPRRVRTPPAPLHGDNWEPFSPRRSSRVAAQRGLHHEQTGTPRLPRARRDITPAASSKRSAPRADLTLSPPSSPVSPHAHRSPRSIRRVLPFDSDSDNAAPTPARRFLSTIPSAMLPTPAKTPRKRVVESGESLSTTARVLFPSRPATIDEVVPTPRKSRKTFKNAYTLESFAELGESSSSKIQIFTDSKERIPTKDDDEENPFVVKKGKGKAKAMPQKSRKASSRAKEMDEAAERDEGIIYIFRGKKILRKFHDDALSNPAEEPEASGDDLQLRRQVGYEAHRPLTRSSIKPRLLFKEEIQRRKAEKGETDEEEAVTDIETPVATPSRRKGKTIMHLADSLQEATPPPTVHKAKREISFDSWSRVKSAHSSSSSSRSVKKRSGSPLARDADKRIRREPSSVPNASSSVVSNEPSSSAPSDTV